MQILFKEIAAGNIDAVKQRLAKDPGAIALIATSPPKKFAGQSPLQIAYRHGEFEIAALLLELGADPNFIEHRDREPWAMPVLHHAIKAAVMRSRWLQQTQFGPGEDPGWQLRNTAERADAAYAALQLLLESGADVQALDSFGNSALGRAVLDARRILPQYHHNEPEWVDPMPLNPELIEDLTRIFDTLMARGADPNSKERDLGTSLAEYYHDEPVARFLRA